MRTQSSNNQSETALGVTEPWYLIDLGFTTPIRLSSKSSTTYDSIAYTAASLKLTLLGGQAATLRVFNDDDIALGGSFIADGPGKTVTIYEVFGAGPFSPGDADLYFSGKINSGRVSQRQVDLDLLGVVESLAPIYRVTDDLFHHLPPDGAQIQTPSGVTVLRRDN